MTGATSGIGRATACALAVAGARVLLTGRDPGRGAAVLAEIRDGGGEAAFHAADLRSTAAVDELVGVAADRFGRIDIAFNNAGIFDRMRAFDSYDDNAWDEMIAVNLSSVFRCMRAEITAMLASGGGVIVNNASTVGHRGSDRASPAYVAAKHGVIGLTRQAALEYVDRGIRVNAGSPGPTRTAVSAPLEAQGAERVRSVLSALNPPDCSSPRVSRPPLCSSAPMPHR